MDLRKAFHTGQVEGAELRNGNPVDLDDMKQTVKDFVGTLKTLKNAQGKDAFHVADRDFIKTHASMIIHANNHNSSLTLNIKDEQPFVQIETNIRERGANDGEYTSILQERSSAMTVNDALEQICRWVGRAAPELEVSFADTFEKYDFIDVAP